MTLTRFLSLTLLLLITSNSCAWNALGHKLVAQIAYDNLTPQAKRFCKEYITLSRHQSLETSFINSATWLDQIRKQSVHTYDSYHYIDIPFSADKTLLPKIPAINALFGIKHAIAILASAKSTKAAKRLNMRILIHLVGDIHQPLHTATEISQRLPGGDLGGNLFVLGRNHIGKNLHQYWDQGGGFLSGNASRKQIRKKATLLERKWPCSNSEQNPEQWVIDAHFIALNQAYKLPHHTVPNSQYRLNTQNVTQKQLLFAGCRLALIINRLVTAAQ